MCQSSAQLASPSAFFLPCFLSYLFVFLAFFLACFSCFEDFFFFLSSSSLLDSDEEELQLLLLLLSSVFRFFPWTCCCSFCWPSGMMTMLLPGDAASSWACDSE